jgi:ribosomal RNA-processing protein 36
MGACVARVVASFHRPIREWTSPDPSTIELHCWNPTTYNILFLTRMMVKSLPTYDEATSGSEDDISEDESSVASEIEQQTNTSKQKGGSSSSSADHDSDDDSDNGSSSSDSDSDDSSSSGKDSHPNQQEHELNESDDEELPLQERIQRNEQQGLSLKESRKRKSRAIEVAVQRLKHNNSNDNDNDNNDNGNNNSNKTSDHEKIVKKSKHAPAEVSSKRSDYFRRGAPKLNESGIGVEIGAHRYKPLDPRASNLHGHYNEEQFEKNYGFLEKMRQEEIAKLKKQIVARKITGKRGQAKRRRMGITDQGNLEDDKERLKQLMQEKADLERRKLNRTAKQAVKKQMRDQVEQGKGGAYFLKRKERRGMELQAKMEAIRKKGGDAAVDKAVNKRRKKQKSKDAKIFAK